MTTTVETTESKSSNARRNTAEARARWLLESPFFFNEYLAAMAKSGLVGEQANALVLLVVTVSRLLSRPICAFVKGRSSSGKNWLVRLVLALMPEDQVRELTSASAKAFNYSKDDFRHRVLFLQERDGSTRTGHQCRLLISEDKIIHAVTTWLHGQ